MSKLVTVKILIKSRFPRAAAAYRDAREALFRRSLTDIFTEIYHSNEWQDSESVSGRGSTLGRTGVIMAQLPTLAKELRIETLLDAACGDFNWMRHTKLNDLKYIGVDVVPDLIKRNQKLYASDRQTFVVADITRSPLPHADAILCRDCLIHLSFRSIDAAISNFKKARARYLLCTTHSSVTANVDIPDGSWRSVNLQLPPFNFPEPMKVVVEDAELGKILGVWRLEDL
jgi:hypothetical protein